MFHKKGYVAASVSDILELADVPRGSLYHHFPGGKRDLSIAAARHSADRVLQFIKLSFETARADGAGFIEVIRRICGHFAVKFDSDERWDFSPMTAMLLDQDSETQVRDTAREIYSIWRVAFVSEAMDFGVPEEQAILIARKLLMLIEGAWVVSRANDTAEPFYQAANFMIPGTLAILSGEASQ